MLSAAVSICYRKQDRDIIGSKIGMLSVAIMGFYRQQCRMLSAVVSGCYREPMIRFPLLQWKTNRLF